MVQHFFFGIDGKSFRFFSIRVFVDVSSVLLSMSKRAGNKLEKLLGGHRQPVSFVKSSMVEP